MPTDPLPLRTDRRADRLHALPQIALCVAVLAAAFLSYHVNVFGVASAEWFETFQADSERLVLDGMLHAEKAGTTPVLGRYSRPGVERPDLAARKLFDRGEQGTQFSRYKSQYGLQVKLLYMAESFGFNNVSQLHAIAALFMALVVTALFATVAKDHSIEAALAFAGVLIVSPWVVVSARNLYWFLGSLFLPFLVSMYWSSRIFSSAASWYSMFGILFVAYLFKLLSGYEYATTLVISACVPIVYHGIRQHVGGWRLSKALAINGAVAVAAFLTALGLHASSIDPDGAGSAWSQILVVAEKRIASNDPEQTARIACEAETSSHCRDSLTKSLTSNPLSVAAGYLIMPDFLPWLGAGLRSLDPRRADVLGAAVSTPSVATARQLVAEFGIKTIVLSAAGPVAFVAFLIGLYFICRKAERSLQLAMICALAAPFSWFVIAKGHSYIHYHINYILWYVPFIPFSMIAVVGHLQKRMQAKGPLG